MQKYEQIWQSKKKKKNGKSKKKKEEVSLELKTLEKKTNCGTEKVYVGNDTLRLSS